MHVELRVEARRDSAAGAWFYDRQRDGLGDYFLDCLFDDLQDLATQAGIHEIVYGLHSWLKERGESLEKELRPR